MKKSIEIEMRLTRKLYFTNQLTAELSQAENNKSLAA
jgi:hypothetical protein